VQPQFNVGQSVEMISHTLESFNQTDSASRLALTNTIELHGDHHR